MGVQVSSPTRHSAAWDKKASGSFISFSASFLPVSSLSSASPLCAHHVSSNLSPLTMASANALSLLDTHRLAQTLHHKLHPLHPYQVTNVQRQRLLSWFEAALVGREVPFFMRQCMIESQLQPPRQKSRCSAPLFFCQRGFRGMFNVLSFLQNGFTHYAVKVLQH
ncbi:hypothetical protein BDZ97DRAFT_1896415 [Flammula alnicola]|nr:hypothetical protein BDZ97DRAFT_1896415 [Flammula alnicola]